MIDLGNRTILLRNRREYERILEKLKEQGYRWNWRGDLECLQAEFPFALIVEGEDKTVDVHDINPYGYKVCEASDLLDDNEMTEREFVEWMSKAGQYDGRDCTARVFSYRNAEGGFSCCDIKDWIGNEDEVLELAKAGRITIYKKAKEELSMKESLNALIKDKSNDEIFRCITYLTEKMKEKE